LVQVGIYQEDNKIKSVERKRLKKPVSARVTRPHQQVSQST
jgi:hypothetical protein